jgi:hypothetical protein
MASQFKLGPCNAAFVAEAPAYQKHEIRLVVVSNPTNPVAIEHLVDYTKQILHICGLD